MINEEIPYKDLPEWTQEQLQLTTHPVVIDEDGVFRYKEHAVVRYLYDHFSISAEVKAAYRRGCFTREEFMQYYRDIGCSLEKFEEVWYTKLEEFLKLE